jgi:hypothetical protein
MSRNFHIFEGSFIALRNRGCEFKSLPNNLFNWLPIRNVKFKGSRMDFSIFWSKKNLSCLRLLSRSKTSSAWTLLTAVESFLFYWCFSFLSINFKFQNIEKINFISFISLLEVLKMWKRWLLAYYFQIFIINLILYFKSL